MGEIFEADSRLLRTLRALFLRPGLLAQAFARGRRAHYVSPFRLYLFASLLYFLVVSFVIGPSDSSPPTEETSAAAVATTSAFLSDPMAVSAYLEYLPIAVIFALPLYALLLQFVFIGRRAYAESFVFVLHLQTIGFFVFILFMPWMEDGDAGWIDWAFTLPLGVYLFLALKRFYGMSVFRTFAGWVAAMSLYILFMIAVLLGTYAVAELSIGNDISRIFMGES
ncbi:MAG: DUF3667 domain-containing protein [Gammaproteobacteria bacterium]|nr:DUF3667 domain-containing protein [Gammaproteobacteria bacterium]